MRRRLLTAAFATVGVVAALLGTQSAAQAQTVGRGWVEQATTTGYCYAEVEDVVQGGKLYAQGYFQAWKAGWTCTGWLERSTDGGQSWHMVSGYHAVASRATNTEAYTGAYYNDGYYLARVCFAFSFANAAIHCSPGYRA